MMVELIHAESFQPPPCSSEVVRCELLHRQRMIFAALSHGPIAGWKRRAETTTGHVDSKPQLLEGHTGKVLCLVLAQQEGMGQEGYLLFSGGADRTVRVWDPSVRDLKKTCVQTLRCHGGSVTSIVYNEGVLISCSTDRTIKVFKADGGREMMLYPWYSLTQTLADLDCWVNDLALHMGEGAALYVGDEQGTLSAYRVIPATRETPLELKKWRRQPNAHSLGISRLMMVQEEQAIITSSYDNSVRPAAAPICMRTASGVSVPVRVFDAQAGSMLLAIQNINKCRFTALHWNTHHQELMLGDEMGYVYFWNVTTEKCFKCERVCGPKTPASGSAKGGRGACAVTSLKTASDELLVSTPGSCDVWLILRDVKYNEIKGHVGAVTALCVSDVGAKQHVSSSGEGQVIYSASLDNTIRVWDPYDMAESSEISCLLVSSMCEFLITGNDDGSIRLWNPDSGSTISLAGHTNTVCCLDVGARGGAELLLSAGFDGHVGVWDITKKRYSMPRLEAMFRAHSREILCLKINALNKTFITAGNDRYEAPPPLCIWSGDLELSERLFSPLRNAHVWSLLTYEHLARLEGHKDAITCLALDGNFLLSASDDGAIHMWDLHSYMPLGVILAHEASVTDMMVIPENGYLVSCSTDRTVRVWDYGMAQELQVWRHPEEFRCVAHYPSTGHIIVGTEQHNVPEEKVRRREEAERMVAEAEAAARNPACAPAAEAQDTSHEVAPSPAPEPGETFG
ncbi:MAG: hypothetical protein SGPRY_011596 [Prymnesium sp.]